MLRLQAKLDLKAFGIVIRKEGLFPDRDPHDPAWDFLLQRLERLAEVNQRSGGPSPGIVAWPK